MVQKKSNPKTAPVSKEAEIVKQPLKGFDMKRDVAMFAPHLQSQFDELAKFEKQIAEKLSKPEHHELMLKNPAAFFSKNKISVPPAILSRIKGFNFEEAVKADSFMLPDGTVMSPKVKIKITTNK